jgi:hypothetical protein
MRFYCKYICVYVYGLEEPFNFAEILHPHNVSAALNMHLMIVFSDWNRDSSVSIVTSYGLDDRWVGIRVPARSRIFSSPPCPDRCWDPPKLLPNGYGGRFP